MFLKKTPATKNKTKDIYLAIAESFYDAEEKKNRQRTIKPIGYLSDLMDEYDDPIAHFTQIAKEMTEEKKKNHDTNIKINMSEKMDVGENDLKNVGYCILKELYRQLDLDRFWRQKIKNRRIQYPADRIARLLILARILYPASKKKTFEDRHTFFEKFDGFELEDIYHCLDLIHEHQEELQKWIYEHSDKICKRDMSVSYFDCTNYYFDIGVSDMDTLDDDGCPVDKNGNKTAAKYRKRGPEKNHRPDPIVEMGLLMDKNGIPLAFDLFPGNESEKIHMRPIINRVKQEFSDSRIIFVADRGLNTSDNIYFLNGDNRGETNLRDGYVYGQSIRGADEEFKKWVIDSTGYVTDLIEEDSNSRYADEDRCIRFQHKSRIHPKTIRVNLHDQYGKAHKKSVLIDQKQMVYYSGKYAKKQKKDREIMIERARDLISHPQKYTRVTAAGSASYIQNISFNKTTGEIVEGKELFLDEEKIAEEEKYDGYYSIVTSELEMSDLEMRNIYRGLALIEDTFKISKSDFDSRPVFARTNDHIDAHFTTCFVALVIIRLLQAKLGHDFPVRRILTALRSYNCTSIEEGRYKFVFFDEVLKKCQDVFGIELDNKYRTQEQIRRMLHY